MLGRYRQSRLVRGIQLQLGRTDERRPGFIREVSGVIQENDFASHAPSSLLIFDCHRFLRKRSAKKRNVFGENGDNAKTRNLHDHLSKSAVMPSGVIAG